MKNLEARDWVGNVRELESVIERAVITSKGTLLQLADETEAVGTDKTIGATSAPGVKSLADAERNHIVATLDATGWQLAGEGGAAAILGVNPSTLRSRMQKLGIRRPALRSDAMAASAPTKEADKRSFKQAVQYQEGRTVRNSRRARAMEKGSRFGRNEQEEAWQNAEVDALYRLLGAGVRVPQPYGCFEGVLLMELITDGQGNVAPRLNDVSLSTEQALAHHAVMMHNVKRMLCAGLVHGDLSEFNVLVDEHGPVIIDLPQAVDAAANNHAEWMLERDVNRITAFYAQYAPELQESKYAKEIWALYTGIFANVKVNRSMRIVPFARPVTARYFRFVGLHAVSSNHLCLAELGVVEK